MVKPASRMFRAISFGVFWRLAPSTRLIMRSRNPSPGSAVTRMMSQSESTRVPPVTALRSPPASRITGALSPVTALSSTEAMPSTISPSAGMMSLTSTRNTSSLRSPTEETSSTSASRRGARSFLALVSLRVLRSASAWALPRPSATASAKLAKRTVNHSHSATAPMNPTGASPRPARAWIHRAVVRTLPTSTTNITGLRTSRRGSSLRKESQMAR